MSGIHEQGASSGSELTGLFVIDDQQRLVEWSDAAARLLEISAEQGIGRPCYEVVHGYDAFGRPICQPHCVVLQALQRGRLASSASLLVRQSSPPPLRLRCELSALPGTHGGALGRLTVASASQSSNGSAAPHAPTASPNVVHDLAALATLTTSLSSSTLGQGWDRALDILREATHAESAELFLAEPSSHDLLLAGYRGPFRAAFFQRVRFRLGEGFPGLATTTHEAVLTEDLGHDSRYLRSRVAEKGYRSYVCVPLFDGDGALGAVCVSSRQHDLDCAQAERLLGWAAAPIAIALRAGMLRARQLVGHDASLPDADGEQVFDHLLHAVLRDICAMAQADGGSVVVVNPATGGMVRRISDGVSDDELCPLHERPGAAESCPVLTTNRGVVLYGPRSGWPSACQRRHCGGAVVYCLPMRVGDDEVGAIELIFRRSGPSPPTRHLPMVYEMADQAASQIKHSYDAFEQRRRLETAYRQAPGDGVGETQNSHQRVPGERPDEPFLHIRCLGAFELYRQGVLVTPQMFKRRKALTLLKVLLLNAGRPVSRDTLIETLWPESDPRKSISRLYVVVHTLREIVEPGGGEGEYALIRTDGDRYVFTPDARCWLDLAEFRGAILNGQRAQASGDREAALAAYSAAAHLYRGDLLEDEPFADWCWLEREHLRQTYLSALQKLAGLSSAVGDLSQAIGVYRRALQVDPLREEVQRQLIECLWQAGRRDEALRQYEQLCVLLRRELDVEPLPETEALVGRIRAESVAARPALQSADSV